MRLIYLLPCLLLVTASHPGQAQFFTDRAVEKQPYLLSGPYFDDINSTGIKKVSIVVEADKSRGLVNDTLMVYHYDPFGRITAKIRYENNRRSSVNHFQWENERLLGGWYEEKSTGPYHHVAYVYNDSGSRIMETSYTVHRNDTSNLRNRYNHHDDENLLTAILIKDANGKEIYRNQFEYSQKRLIKRIAWLNPALPGNFVQAEYKYDQHGDLLRKWETQWIDTVSYLISDFHYEYKEGKLVKEHYFSSAKQPETMITYRYHANQLAAMHLRKDSFYRDVEYTYEADKIKTIRMRTNAWNGFHRETQIPVAALSSLTPLPFLYEEEFQYDHRGNLIEKKHLLNGKIEKIVRYIIEYGK